MLPTFAEREREEGRKEEKYLDLLEEAEQAGYKAQLITLEVGSRGLPHMPGFNKLKNYLNLGSKVFLELLIEASCQAIIGSFSVWCARNKALP